MYLREGLTTREMKILFVAAHLGGGAGKAISGMAIQCRKKFEVEIVLLEVPREVKYVRLLQECGIAWSVVSNGREAADAASSSDVTILNWWNHPLTIRFLLDVRQARCRMIIWSHINGCYYPLLPAAFLNLFSHILFTSPVSYENKQWSGVELEQITRRSSIVYGMGDFKPREAAQKTDYAIRSGQFTVGYVGTISYEKMNRDFIGYCVAAAQAVPNIHYKMIGQPEPIFLNEATQGCLGDHFSFAGYLEEPGKSYLTFDILGYLLRPESYATTENVLLEAMSHGLPIIALNNPVERYIIQDGINGFLVSNREEYAGKVFELYQSEDKRRQIGRQAREYVINQYDPNANFLRFRQAVESAMEIPCSLVDVGALFQNGFEAFCYFSGIDRFSLGTDNQVDYLLNSKQCYAGMGESKAGIAQYCRYFPDEKRLRQLLETAGRVRRVGGE